MMRPAFYTIALLAPFAIAYHSMAQGDRYSALVSIFERYDHATASRIARELGVLREYVRGEPEVVKDIAQSFDLYEVMFPRPEQH